MTLLRLLPFLIGDLIPEEDSNWECLLLLHAICSICTAFAVTEEHVVKLEWLIQAHHELFVKLYGKEAMTPKFHFAVHLPSQMRRYFFIFLSEPSLSVTKNV